MWWSQFPHCHKEEACMCGLVVFVSTLCFHVHLHVACVNPFNVCSRKTWCNECRNWSQIKKLKRDFFSCRVCVCCEHCCHYCDNCLIHLQYFGSFVSRRKPWSLMLSLICQVLHFVWIFRLRVWLQILRENVAMTTSNTLSDSVLPKLETGKEDEILLHHRVWAASIFGPLQSPQSSLVLPVFAAVMQSTQLRLCIKKMIKNAV